MAHEEFRLTVRIVPKSDLHTAGPGRTLPLVDRSVAVGPRETPYIPASSVRGRVRAHLERLLRGLGEPVCAPPRPDRVCPHDAAVVRDLAGRGAAEPFCLPCRLFGSVWRSSPIAFSDFTAVVPAPEAGSESMRARVALALRPGVGISRFLGTAEEERLYVLETAAAGSPAQPVVYEGTVEGRLDRTEVGWLLVPFRALTHVGGGKARGLGRVTVEVVQCAFWDGQTKQWVPANWVALLEEVMRGGPC